MKKKGRSRPYVENQDYMKTLDIINRDGKQQNMRVVHLGDGGVVVIHPNHPKRRGKWIYRFT